MRLPVGTLPVNGSCRQVVADQLLTGIDARAGDDVEDAPGRIGRFDNLGDFRFISGAQGDVFTTMVRSGGRRPDLLDEDEEREVPRVDRADDARGCRTP
jgi:hypothetical protein